MKHNGIPSEITLDFARDWVRPRVSAKRFKHIEGVAQVAVEIAGRCGADTFLAELSGWLHDACKEVKDKELVQMAKEFDLPLDPILERHGHLLHGPVAAEVSKRELKITSGEVYAAIAEHTLGAVPMSTLSKVSFLADCLEASRPTSYTDPIWAALDLDGACNLDAAIVKASDLGLMFLVEDGKPIHPKTVAVRNYYLDVLREANRAGAL